MNKFNRADIIDRAFIDFVKQWRGSRLHGTTATQALLHAPLSSASRLTGHDAIELLESQMQARHLDLVARMLRARDAAFYTIASAGHEGNAVVGRLLRLTDPAFLHYRSAAFMMERARKVPVQLLFPLVVCVLPAFALLTVVPLLVSSLGTLS